MRPAQSARAPLGARFTAFTGELVATLNEGIPQRPHLLDMDAVYRHPIVRLIAKGMPLPQRGQLDNGGNIAIAHNLAPPAMPVT